MSHANNAQQSLTPVGVNFAVLGSASRTEPPVSANRQAHKFQVQVGRPLAAILGDSVDWLDRLTANTAGRRDTNSQLGRVNSGVPGSNDVASHRTDRLLQPNAAVGLIV